MCSPLGDCRFYGTMTVIFVFAMNIPIMNKVEELPRKRTTETPIFSILVIGSMFTYSIGIFWP